MKKNIFASALLFLISCGICFGQASKSDADLQYKLLATTKTSTMQKELDETAAKGYRILVGSPTSGTEMAIFLSREASAEKPYQYKLLATTRTGTMQKELNEAASSGFRLLPRTMIAKPPLLGGVEVVMILEKPPTVQKEIRLQTAGDKLNFDAAKGSHRSAKCRLCNCRNGQSRRTSGYYGTRKRSELIFVLNHKKAKSACRIQHALLAFLVKFFRQSPSLINLENSLLNSRCRLPHRLKSKSARKAARQ
ncbi:MAG: hypothetical protein LH614_08620 [Pyrinomonadaceae bacterium]|nr:hypothetical protein [Pyrinomonadaceae bacterium]